MDDLRFSALALACVSALTAVVRADAPGTGWTGQAGANWTNSGNWDNGSPQNGYDLFFGVGYAVKGTGFTTSNNDYANPFAGHKIVFQAGYSTPFTLTGNAITLYDYGGASPAYPQIDNESSATQTINFNVAFSDGSGNQKAEILANGGNIALGGGIDLPAAREQLQINSTAGRTITFGGVVSSSGNGGNNGVAINGNNLVIYKAANTYAGTTYVNAGKLQFDTGGSLANSVLALGDTSGSVTAEVDLLAAGGGQTLSTVFNPRAGTSGTLTIASLNTSGTNTLSGHIGADNGFTLSQAAGGTLNVTSVRTAGSTTTGIDLKANTLTVNAAGSINVGGTLYSSSGSSTLVKQGGGTLTLGGGTSAVPSAIGSYTQTAGITNVSGTLNIGSLNASNQVSLGGGGVLNVSGNSTDTVQTFTVGNGSAGTLNVNGGSMAVTTGTSSGQGFVVGGVAAGATGAVNVSAGSLTVTGPVFIGAGNTGANGQAAGTLTVGGSGTFTAGSGVSVGGTAAASGTINLNTGGTLAAPSVTGIGTGGTSAFNFNGGRLLATASATSLLSGFTTISVTGGGTINPSTFNVTLSQPLTHGGTAAVDGGLLFTGTGTVNLLATNTYTGDTTIGDGVFIYTSATALQNTNVVYTGAGSLLGFTAGTSKVTLGGLTGTQNFNSSNGSTGVALTVGYTNASGRYEGVVGGKGSLTKTGTGTLTLTATNTYGALATSGSTFAFGTTVSQGILQANGVKTTNSSGVLTGSATGLGDVAVSSGGTLVGTGQIGGKVNVSGTISAGTGATLGDTAGNLTTGSETWNGGNKDVVKFFGSAHVGGGAAQAGKDFDLLTINGLLSLSGDPAAGLIQLVLTKAANGTFTAPAAGTRYAIANAVSLNSTHASGTPTYYSGTPTTDLTALFALTTTDLGLPRTSFSVIAGPDASGSGEDLFLQYNGTSSTPEAGTLSLAALAAVPLLTRRGRRTA